MQLDALSAPPVPSSSESEEEVDQKLNHLRQQVLQRLRVAQCILGAGTSSIASSCKGGVHGLPTLKSARYTPRCL
eukprot:904348-Pelagomonas_calceolata.AAC.3